MTALILQERHTEGGHNAGRAWAGPLDAHLPHPFPSEALAGADVLRWASPLLFLGLTLSPGVHRGPHTYSLIHSGLSLDVPIWEAFPAHSTYAGTTPPLLTRGNGNRDRFTFSFSARYLALPGTREYVHVCPPQDLLTAVPQG